LLIDPLLDVKNQDKLVVGYALRIILQVFLMVTQKYHKPQRYYMYQVVLPGQLKIVFYGGSLV